MMAKKMYAYVITDAVKGASLDVGDIYLTDIQWHRGRSRTAEITTYDREKASFRVIAKAVLVGCIENTEGARSKLLRLLKFLESGADD